MNDYTAEYEFDTAYVDDDAYEPRDIDAEYANEDDRVFNFLTDDEDYSDADAVESDGDADGYWDEEMYDPSWR